VNWSGGTFATASFGRSDSNFVASAYTT